MRPEVVVEVAMADIQSEDSSGKPICSRVLQLDRDAWRTMSPFTGASVLDPRLSRVREDKQVTAVDVWAAQLAEHCGVASLDEAAVEHGLPESVVVRRDAWTRTTKGKVTVRELLVWRANKDAADAAWPAPVVCFVDFSPGRKGPLKREVRHAPDEARAKGIADAMVEDNIKKGGRCEIDQGFARRSWI